MEINSKIEEKLERIRKQGKAQIIILVASLGLVFLWFTFLSWVFGDNTFGQEAFVWFYSFGSFDLSFMIMMTFIITMLFTYTYFLILKRYLPLLSADVSEE